MDKKVIIAFSFATIMLIAGLSGLIYYNPEASDKNIKTPKLESYINKYNLRNIESISHKSTFMTETPAISGTTTTNNTVTMDYTFYRGSNNVTGQLLHVYVNGKLEHESLLVNSTGLNGNITVVPLYSKSGNYNITTLSNNIKTGKSVNNDVYVDLQARYSWGPNGKALAFTQDMTELLIAVLLVSIAIAGLATMGFLAAILAIGTAVIGLYDSWGGNNGVFFFVAHYWYGNYAWINSPYNQVPNDLKEYGSDTLTIYNGDLQ